MAPRKDIEATINTYGNYGKDDIKTSARNNPYNVIGRSGQGYDKVYTVPNGQSDYTGSKSGITGVQVKVEGSAILHLTGGGSIAAALLPIADTQGEIIPLSIAKVTAASSATIWLYRGQK